MESTLQGEQIQELELDYNETEIVLLCARFISAQRKRKTIEQIPQMVYMNFLMQNFSQTEILSQKTYVAITPPISSKEHADIIFTPTGDNFHSLQRSYIKGISEKKPHRFFEPLLKKMIYENPLIDSEKLKEYLNALVGIDVIREALLVLKTDSSAQIRISIPILIQGKWTAYEIKMAQNKEKYELKVVKHPTYEVFQGIEDPLHTYLIGLLEKNSTCDVKVEDSPTEIIRACFSECYGIMTVQDCFDLLLYGRECSIIPEKFAVILLEQHKHFLTNIPIPLVNRIDRIILTYKSTLNVNSCLNLQGIIQGIYKVSTKKVLDKLVANDKAKEAIFNIQQMLDELALLPNFDNFAQMLDCIRVLIPYVQLIKEEDKSWIHLSSFFQLIFNYVQMKISNTKKKTVKLNKLYKKIESQFDEFCIDGTQLFHFRSNSKKWKLIEECKKRYADSQLPQDNKEKKQNLNKQEMKQQETEATETGKEEISDAHSKNKEIKTNSEAINVTLPEFSYKSIMESMDLKFQEFGKEITTLKSENSILNDKVSTLTNEITTLKRDNIILTNKVRFLVKTNKRIIEQNSIMTQDLSTLRSKLTRQNITLTNETEKKNAIIRKLEEDNEESSPYKDRLVIREILNILRKSLMKLMNKEHKSFSKEQFLSSLGSSDQVKNLENSLKLPTGFTYQVLLARVYNTKAECCSFIHSPDFGQSPTKTFFLSLKRVSPDLISQEEISFFATMVKKLIPDIELVGLEDKQNNFDIFRLI